MCKASSVNHTVADYWGSTVLCVTPRNFATATVNCFVKARKKKMLGFANLDADWMIQHRRQVCKLISHTNVGMIFVFLMDFTFLWISWCEWRHGTPHKLLRIMSLCSCNQLSSLMPLVLFSLNTWSKRQVFFFSLICFVLGRNAVQSAVIVDASLFLGVC